MRTLTELFETEKNKKTGASPVWILEIPFVAGTIFISDRTLTITNWDDPPIVTLPWVHLWGQIDEDIANDLSLSIVSDFPLAIIIDPDAAANIEDLLSAETVETLKCVLYLWFEGLDASTDPPVPIWTGNIIEKKKINELLYDIRLADEGVRVDKNVGTVLSLADHANASLDDVGYTLNIVYGAVEKVPARRLDVGKKTSLIAAIDDNDVDFYLTDGIDFANGTSMMIGSEQIDITTISGNHITACTRSVGATDPASHSAGELVLEKQATCVFSFADHPVKSIGNIYALRKDGVPIDVTSLCTKYTGQGGANDLAGYAGKAVITCPGYIAFSQAVSIGLVDTIDVDDTTDVDDNIVVHDQITVSDDISVSASSDQETLESRWCSDPPVSITEGTAQATVTYETMPSGTVLEKWIEVSFVGGVTTNPTSGSCTVSIDGATVGTIDTTGWHPSASSPMIKVKPTTFNTFYLQRSGTISGGDYFVTINSVKQCQRRAITIDTSKTGSASKGGTAHKDGSATKTGVVTKTGTVTGSASGNDVLVGDNILISGEGYQDDGSGTFTGMASALIERPDHIIKHFLYTQAAWPVADFVTDAATPFASDSYAFSVVISESKKLREWLAYMAIQCRCRFRFAGGKAYLLYRPDTLSSDKTITTAMTMMNPDHTTSMQVIPSSLDEILNKIQLYYQRDWSKSAGKEAYQAIWKDSDETSIGIHGEKEWANFFLFDFVRDAAMAADVGGFFLAHYKDLKKYIQGVLFLNNCEIEFADGITFAALSNLLCEVGKAGFAPGNALVNDRIHLIAREY